MGENKALTGVEIKDADQGLVQAVFSTFNVKDSDGDVTEPGAFEDGVEVRISAYNHASWHHAPPVGKGVIRTTDDEAILDGRFFLKNQSARDTFEIIKEMGDLQEWSYGFDILESSDGEHEDEKVRLLQKLKVHEVSPVLLGAGVDTRTLGVKLDGREVGEAAYKYLLAAPRTSGAWATTSGTNIAYENLTALGYGLDHPLKHGTATPFSEEAERVLGDVESLVLRAQAFGSQGTERKEGRTLSSANRERLATLLSALGEAGGALEALLADTDPVTDPDKHRLISQFVRFQSLSENFI